MPIKLKNMNVIPPTGGETVSVLGLDIPLTGALPFGAQVGIVDLNRAKETGEVGQFEWLMRVFCLFTWRLPKRERVDYDWLASQTIEPEEMSELMTGVMALLTEFMPKPTNDGDESGEAPGEGNAPKPRQKTRAKTKS